MQTLNFLLGQCWNICVSLFSLPKHFASRVSRLLRCCWPSSPVAEVGSGLPSLGRSVSVGPLGWSDPECSFQKNVLLGGNMVLNQWSLDSRSPALVSFLILRRFLLFSRVSVSTLAASLKHVVPPHPSVLLLLASWLYFCICSILLVILGDLSLSSCLQYLLQRDGHLCLTSPLLKTLFMCLQLSRAEMAPLVSVGSFWPCPVSELNSLGLERSALLGSASYLLPALSDSPFPGLCIWSQSCLFPCGGSAPRLSHAQS